METFSKYVESIEQLAHPEATISPNKWRTELVHCLNGGPNRVLRLQEHQAELKQQGAYFTGNKMATRIAEIATRDMSSDTRFFDPACGAGDLLLAVAKTFPVANSIHDTLVEWSSRLAGCDISSDFVRLAKVRLLLLAAKRCGLRPPLKQYEGLESFPAITTTDFLTPNLKISDADVIVMNPPFAYTNAPKECDWASGRINLAALFLERVLRDVATNARIVAILPEVLRSGSRYVLWRNMIHSRSIVQAEKSLGSFDKWTDVDVYLLHLRKNTVNHTLQVTNSASERLGGVGKRFHVHVGPVVPHRHPESGPTTPYLHARSIPPWTECDQIHETRNFEGRLFQPPFVTIRRTSRPGNGKRALATLVCEKTGCCSGEPSCGMCSQRRYAGNVPRTGPTSQISQNRWLAQ